ncbi:AfsR/SARP family transcriptional regulator [Micromonospora sp. NPDC092111]|uniref:AfsR/SARP family transcriptional regulator n=1 Tax=Micromonospora sp. NPDC092111 TaxID=3364289 RepID=UPI0037F2B3B6
MTAIGTSPATLDIRLLGPLEVGGGDARGGAPPPLGGPRQRTLLGLLALRAPRVVSVSHLIDGIWGDDPPGSATKTLHAHVAYLRRSLAAAGLDRAIVTRAPGYLLAATAEQVDARRFEDLVRRGRAALGSGATVAGVGCLREALRLWRGEVLADCPLGEWARAEAAALREARWYAQEELTAAELVLGQHTRVAAELETLVAAEPLRERLWQLLVTALYRSGRRGDALGAYRRARAVLVEELGLEPGPALRRLETAILAGEPVDATGGVDGAAAVVLADPATGLPESPESALPVPLTSLIGRRTETEEVAGVLAGRRLVTLTGVGGCGKTRLAIAVAARIADRHESDARFVDLSATTDPELLATMVATTLGLPQRPDLSPIDLLTRQLRPHRLLLVLDNCEHLVEPTAALVGSLLTGCPGLRVLTTSREPLGVPGELAWPVPPLTVPAVAGDGSRRGPGSLAELRGYGAVELFLDRAVLPAVREMHDDDAPALAAICAGLDGLPLALELAAARTTVLTLREIADRIHDPGLLRTTRPGGRGHHHALDATIAWSYRLLDPELRSVFRHLAVFHGGFTLDAVEAVAPRTRGRAVDVVADLVGKSLVVVDRRRAGARYRLLETIRHYAAERLAEGPHELAEARRRHADHYRSLAEDIDRNLHGPELDRLLGRLTLEHDNLVAVLAWSAGNGSGLDELRLAAALARYCHLRGRYREGRRWLEDALTRSDDDASPELARALLGVAHLAFFECDYAGATDHGERALTVHRALANLPGTARSLSLLASVDRERGRYARSGLRYQEAVALYREVDDDRGVADTLQLLGFTTWLAGDLDQAGRLIDDALARFHLLDDPEGIASARVHLAAVACHQGHHARARWLAEDALARFRKLGFQEGVAWALNICGLVAQHDGEPERAVGLLRSSLEIHCAVGDRWRAASLLEALSGVLAGGGDPETAAELLGAASAIRDTIGAPVPPQEHAARDEAEAAVHRALTDREFSAAHARGETLRLDDLPARLAGLTPAEIRRLLPHA